MNRFTTFWRRQWFLLGLLAVLALGFLAPDPFRGLTKLAGLRNGVVAGVLFLMALPLETSVIRQTIARPGAALWGSLINMGVVPLLAWGGSQLLSGELAVGVIVAAAAPCTLASAAVWTRRAGGNDATAIFVTVITNLTCFLVTPCWLLLLTRTTTAIDVEPMVTQLAWLVVAPMALAQSVRRLPSVGLWASRRKAFCGNLAQTGILWTVLAGSVTCGDHLRATGWGSVITVPELLLMWAITAAVHLIALAIGYQSARALGMSTANQIAVGFAGSQKTLMVGLHIAITYFGGLAILPMISYHVGQLFLDTLVADRWAAAIRQRGDTAAARDDGANKESLRNPRN